MRSSGGHPQTPAKGRRPWNPWTRAGLAIRWNQAEAGWTPPGPQTPPHVGMHRDLEPGTFISRNPRAASPTPRMLSPATPYSKESAESCG